MCVNKLTIIGSDNGFSPAGMTNWTGWFICWALNCCNDIVTMSHTFMYVHRPPKVWHHLEHKRHARVLIPTLEYLLSMIITNWDYSLIIISYMYMNCVFDANLNDNKWVYVLQGRFLNWMKIIANLTKIDSLHSWPQICTLYIAWIWNILSAIRVQKMDL